MCGIFGFRTKDSEWNNFAIQEFYCRQRHRGPDAESTIEIDGFILGHQRLSIIDTSSRSNQPMSRGGSWIVFNGEIYNYKELKSELLEGEDFYTHSDTEILLLLLNKYGLSVLNRLNGMFAFAWYDGSCGRMVLVRDRFGVKPLYWSQVKSSFIFASEIRSIMEVSQIRSPNYSYIKSFIEDLSTDFDENTHIEGVYQVEPGHYLIYEKNGRIEKNKWYKESDFSFDEKIFDNEKSTNDFFENLLVDSIKLRYRSDVPVALTLSGGIDSSVIYVLLKERLRYEVKPFTLIHPGSESDESDKVAWLVGQYNDYYCAITCNHKSYIDELKKSMEILEFPIWNPSAIGYIEVYKRIAESGFKVIIEGHGSDEIFGGYPYMIRMAASEHGSNLNIKKAFEAFNVFYKTCNSSLNQKKNYYFSVLLFGLQIIKSVITNKKYSFEAIVNLAFDRSILPIVLRAFDRLTMSQSLESRAPFLDYRVVEFVKKMPIGFKISNIGSKSILRNILKKYNKSKIYEDSSKMGFALDLRDFYGNHETRQFLIEKVEKIEDKYLMQIKKRALKDLNNDENIMSWGNTDDIWKAASIQASKDYAGNW